MKEIGEAKKGFPPLGEIKKEFPSSPYHYKGNYYYKGNDILVEGEKRLLFNDMEKHEGDTKLFQTYKGFKVNWHSRIF